MIRIRKGTLSGESQIPTPLAGWWILLPSLWMEGHETIESDVSLSSPLPFLTEQNKSLQKGKLSPEGFNSKNWVASLSSFSLVQLGTTNGKVWVEIVHNRYMKSLGSKPEVFSFSL